MCEMNKHIIIKFGHFCFLYVINYTNKKSQMYILQALHFHDQIFKIEYYKATYAIPSTTKLPQ
jgi:hypothetical protein